MADGQANSLIDGGATNVLSTPVDVDGSSTRERIEYAAHHAKSLAILVILGQRAGGAGRTHRVMISADEDHELYLPDLSVHLEWAYEQRVN